VASELLFAHTCDKIEPKQHDPQTINPVLVAILTIHSADIAMDSKCLPRVLVVRQHGVKEL